MKPFIKYTGGKEKELPVIRECMPEYTGRYIEPFVGGGSVYFDVENPYSCINDKSEELINLYRCIKNRDSDMTSYLNSECDELLSLGDFTDSHTDEILKLYSQNISIKDFINRNKSYFEKLVQGYNNIFVSELEKNLKNKISRSKKLDEKNKEKGNLTDKDKLNNMEAALKSAYYMTMRYLLNHSQELSSGRQAAVYFFVREYCYSSMFRYNSAGEFNVPYGGISYNRKDFRKKIEYLLSNEIAGKLTNTEIYCEDFESFMDKIKPDEKDFIFLDPPYDTVFSSYSGNEFGKEDQIRLCEYLKKTPAKILMIIKNTDFIYNLYKDDFNISSFNKKYMVNFKNRNDRGVEHLVITNF